MPNRKLGWALLGASTIAHEWMIDAIRAQPDQAVVAVLSGDAARAATYAAAHAIHASTGSLAELLANPAVDAARSGRTMSIRTETP